MLRSPASMKRRSAVPSRAERRSRGGGWPAEGVARACARVVRAGGVAHRTCLHPGDSARLRHRPGVASLAGSGATGEWGRMDMAAPSRERYVTFWARPGTGRSTIGCFRFASGNPMERPKWCSKCLNRLARPRGVEPLTPRSVVWTRRGCPRRVGWGEGAAVAVAALAQRGITAAAERVVLGCQARPMIERVRER